MKTATIKLFAMLAAFAIFSGCDKLKELADVEFQSEVAIDIPVRLNNDTSGEDQLEVKLSGVKELKEYMDYLEKIKVTSFVVSVPAYNGSDAVYDLELKVDGSTVYKGNDVDVPEMRQKGTTINVADQSTLERIGNNLLNNKKIVVRGRAETKSGAVTASFTVRCTIKMEITANPL